MVKIGRRPRKRVEVYRARKAGKPDGFRYRAIAGNGAEVGSSEESKRHRTYVARQAAERYPASDGWTVILVEPDGSWVEWQSDGRA